MQIDDKQDRQTEIEIVNNASIVKISLNDT